MPLRTPSLYAQRAGHGVASSTTWAKLHELPERIVVDDGPELTSRAMQRWAKGHDIELHFIEPGKPTQNAFIESFNRPVRTTAQHGASSRRPTPPRDSRRERTGLSPRHRASSALYIHVIRYDTLCTPASPGSASVCTVMTRSPGGGPV